jgi:hypothetical protein
MSIRCQICNIEFEKLISSTHLKKHGILTAEYVNKYGKESLTSVEYRTSKSAQSAGKNNPNYGNKMSVESKRLISVANTGNVTWNTGKTLEDTTAYVESARLREERYATGVLTRPTQIVSDATRQKISASVSDYASNNRDEVSLRAKKALETKLKNGHDLAFFRGKKHTDETREKISIKSKIIGEMKQKKSLELMKARLVDLGFTPGNVDGNYLTATCNKCGNDVSYTKQMFQPNKIKDRLCLTCYPPIVNRSAAEIEIFDFISSHVTAIPNYRYDGKKELDIFIPSLNTGIEYNGLYWHSEQVLSANGYSKTKDMDKLRDVEGTGIRLIQIFEDEWKNKREVVESRLLQLIKQNKSATVYARRCVVEEISSSQASVFCNRYHLQGAGRSNLRLGLFFNKELISVMTFSKNNISRKVLSWELNRFCSANYNIPGGASKLFKYFISNNSPTSIVTYADRRWSNGNLYSILGFNFVKNTVPGYWYIKDNIIARIHRFSLRKTPDDDMLLTERENRLLQGYKTIWDSGSSKWEWIPNRLK